MMGLFRSWNRAALPLPLAGLASLPSKELLNMVRDPMLTSQLELARERGELGVLSRSTRDINIEVATQEQLDAALSECWLWYVTYPETDDWALVSFLEARIKDEIMSRAIAKIAGGRKVRVHAE